MTQVNATIEVVYVAGYGRSGSTLLDVLLDASPEVFGAGEVSGILNATLAGRTCSCGEEYSECCFWSSVFSKLKARGLFPEFEAASARYESGDRRLGSKEEFGRLWRAMFGAIAEVSGAAVIVDSSKSSRRSYKRPVWLKQSGFQVKAVHLVRDPRAVMWSVRRGSNRLLEKGENASLAGGIVRALVGWVMSNLAAETVLRIGRIPVLRVRYEDLVSDPIQEVKRIGAFAGFDVRKALTKIERGEPFSPGHGISGNRMRRTGPIRLRNDDEWRRKLPLYGWVVALLAWPVARRYGYRMFSREPHSIRAGKLRPAGTTRA